MRGAPLPRLPPPSSAPDSRPRPPPTPDTPVPATPVPSTMSPAAPDPPVLSSAENTADLVPPLVSIIVQPPDPSQPSSQASLLSESASIDEFSEDEPSPIAPSSPAISSFPSEEGSQSILKEVSIVSSDPMVVEQIDCNVTGPMATNNLDQSNVTGPNVTPGKSNANVTGPKVAQRKGNNNVTGPKLAQSKSKDNVTGPKGAQSKSKENVTGPKVAQSKSNSNVSSNSQSDLPNSQISSIPTPQHDFFLLPVQWRIQTQATSCCFAESFA